MVNLNPQVLAEAVVEINDVFGAKYITELEERRTFVATFDAENPIRQEILDNEAVNEENRNTLIGLINSVVVCAEELEEVAKIMATRTLDKVAQRESAGAAETVGSAKNLLRF